MTEQMLFTFERKILRRIYGPIHGKERWHARWNSEIYDLYYDLNIVDYIEFRRQGGADHIIRLENERVLNVKCLNTKVVRKPKTKWEDVVRRDANRRS
jgi:hypothetical protein